MLKSKFNICRQRLMNGKGRSKGKGPKEDEPPARDAPASASGDKSDDLGFGGWPHFKDIRKKYRGHKEFSMTQLILVGRSLMEEVSPCVQTDFGTGDIIVYDQDDGVDKPAEDPSIMLMKCVRYGSEHSKDTITKLKEAMDEYECDIAIVMSWDAAVVYERKGGGKVKGKGEDSDNGNSSSGHNDNGSYNDNASASGSGNTNNALPFTEIERIGLKGENPGTDIQHLRKYMRQFRPEKYQYFDKARGENGMDVADMLKNADISSAT